MFFSFSQASNLVVVGPSLNPGANLGLVRRKASVEAREPPPTHYPQLPLELCALAVCGDGGAGDDSVDEGLVVRHGDDCALESLQGVAERLDCGVI